MQTDENKNMDEGESHECILEQARNNEADNHATVKLRKIPVILDKPSTYNMCMACLPCLMSFKLEDPKYKCISRNCERCASFHKLWKHGVRSKIFKGEYDATRAS